MEGVPRPQGRRASDRRAVVRALARARVVDERSLGEVARIVIEQDQRSPTLANGSAGVAVGLAHLPVTMRGNRHPAWAALRDAERNLDATRGLLGLHSGLAGFGWALVRVAGALDADVGDATREIDSVLLGALREGRIGEFDLYHGVTGIGVYFLARAADPAARSGARLVCEELVARAEVQGSLVRWRNQHDYSVSGPHSVNFTAGLGIAHGVAGAVLFLIRSADRGLAVKGQEETVRGGLRWIEQHLACSDGEPLVSWCWGDLGCALALCRGSRILGDARLAHLGREIAARTLKVSPLTDRAQDGCLCHGVAGVVLQLRAIFRETRDARFARAARLWSRRLLEMRVAGTGFGGYSFMAAQRDGRSSFVGRPGLLDGAIGVALVLDAHPHQRADRWADCLLVDS